MVHWQVRHTQTSHDVTMMSYYIITHHRVILGESVSCPALNYSGVAVVVIRLVPIFQYPRTPILHSASHMFIPHSHSPFLSVVILAFVKSSGKAAKDTKKGGVSETTNLLSDQPDSLEGSLRDKVVSGKHEKHFPEFGLCTSQS